MSGKQDAGPKDAVTGRGFDLAAIAAEGPLAGSDPTNGIVDVTEDREPDPDSTWSDAVWRTGQANIAGLGSGIG